MKICPSCNRPMSFGFNVGGKIRQRMFDFIANSNGVTIWQIIDHVYGDDRPKDTSIVSSTVAHINKRTRRFGYEIKATHGPGSTYSLLYTRPER